MSLKCKKCGANMNRHHSLEINNDEQGYRCKLCHALHSWIDGSITRSEINHKSILGSIIGKGGVRK